MTNETKPPYRPTKLCPHRLCRPTHTLIGLISLAVLLPVLWRGGLAFLGYLALITVIAMALQKLVWKKSRRDLALEEHLHTGTGGLRLVVRPVWARIAVGMDALFLCGAALAVARSTQPGPDDYDVPVADQATLVSAAIVFGVVAFEAYAHRKATEPAKPLRLPVVAPAPGGAS